MSEPSDDDAGLSRRTVRRSWPPYVGAFVALGCGVALLEVTVMLIAAVDVSMRGQDVTAAERTARRPRRDARDHVGGLAVRGDVRRGPAPSVRVVAARSAGAKLGLLRLVGATPRQVRRMVLGESSVVAVPRRRRRCLLGTAVTPAFVASS